MGKTPVRVNSKNNPGTRHLAIALDGQMDENELGFTVMGTAMPLAGSVTVGIDDLVRQLNLIPGMTVKYQKPIQVPSYLGAVVVREHSDGTTERYVRYQLDSESSLAWVRNTGSGYSNDDVAAVLANGGYEAQPDFPKNGETT